MSRGLRIVRLTDLRTAAGSREYKCLPVDWWWLHDRAIGDPDIIDAATEDTPGLMGPADMIESDVRTATKPVCRAVVIL
jgi:hypothetical protein